MTVEAEHDLEENSVYGMYRELNDDLIEVIEQEVEPKDIKVLITHLESENIHTSRPIVNATLAYNIIFDLVDRRKSRIQPKNNLDAFRKQALYGAMVHGAEQVTGLIIEAEEMVYGEDYIVDREYIENTFPQFYDVLGELRQEKYMLGKENRNGFSLLDMAAKRFAQATYDKEGIDEAFSYGALLAARTYRLLFPLTKAQIPQLAD